MEKKGLGKGLGALIPGADKEAGISVNELEISKISVNPYQPRETFGEEKFQELVNSVRVHGVLQPIVVRSKGGGEYELVAGERRLRAATAAGLSRIPAVVRELTNEQSLEVALVENLQREDINAVDAAIAYKRLMDEFGLSQEDLAFGLGKSRSAVANTMRLLSLPEEIRAKIRAGDISEGHARAILGVEGEERQKELCERVISAGLSVRETERLVREWSSSESGESVKRNVSRETSKEKLDPNLQEIEAHLRTLFATKVNIVRNKGKGRIEIEFYSDEDLERVLSVLSNE